jgi:hypothetical protein
MNLCKLVPPEIVQREAGCRRLLDVLPEAARQQGHASVAIDIYARWVAVAISLAENSVNR